MYLGLVDLQFLHDFLPVIEVEFEGDVIAVECLVDLLLHGLQLSLTLIEEHLFDVILEFLGDTVLQETFIGGLG